jgi:hypothetical protein
VWNFGAVKEVCTWTSVAYPPSFYMHLKDPHAHWEMIQALENRFRVEECSFNTIFGSYQVHRIVASRKVAKNIEKQTRYAAQLYNVDSGRINVTWPKKTSSLAETEMSPGSRGDGVIGDPNIPRDISCVQILNEHRQKFEGQEKVVLADLLVTPT